LILHLGGSKTINKLGERLLLSSSVPTAKSFPGPDFEQTEECSDNLAGVSDALFQRLVDFLEGRNFRGIIIHTPHGTGLKLCSLMSEKQTVLQHLKAFEREHHVQVHCLPAGKRRLANLLPSLSLRFSSVRRVHVSLSGGRTEEFHFELEFWQERDAYFEAASANHISRRLWKDTAGKHGLFDPGKIRNYASILPRPHASSHPFPIDLVFTWVNADDEEWQELYAKYAPAKKSDATSRARFHNRNELLYSLRSWDQYAPFIRKVFIVSNCRPPEWIDLNNPKIHWVPHETILPASALPTFSSHAIEACLHKIPGLADHFIYSNDDFLLTNRASAADFFYPNGIAKVRLEPYGQVNGDPYPGHPDYLNGARNSNVLIERVFATSPTQLVTHSPAAMRRDVLQELEIQFGDDLGRTIHNRFRAPDDVAVATYLHAHYAVLSGKAVPDHTPVWLIQANHPFRKRLRKLQGWKKRSSHKLPLSICLNDGAESHLNEQWNVSVTEFLGNFYAKKSQFEK
jgi:hypothetical protein